MRAPFRGIRPTLRCNRRAACRQPFASSNTTTTYLFSRWSILYRFNCEIGACFILTECLLKTAGTLRQLFDRTPARVFRCSLLQNLSKETIMEMPSILQGDSLTRLLQGAF